MGPGACPMSAALLYVWPRFFQDRRNRPAGAISCWAAQFHWDDSLPYPSVSPPPGPSFGDFCGRGQSEGPAEGTEAPSGRLGSPSFPGAPKSLSGAAPAPLSREELGWKKPRNGVDSSS